MSLRNERVRKELMRDISDIFRKEVRGLEGVVSIVDVEVSHDNSYAKVFYSVLGSPEQIEKDKNIIEKNTGKVRFEIGKRIRLRVTPEIKFIYSGPVISVFNLFFPKPLWIHWFNNPPKELSRSIIITFLIPSSSATVAEVIPETPPPITIKSYI